MIVAWIQDTKGAVSHLDYYVIDIDARNYISEEINRDNLDIEEGDTLMVYDTCDKSMTEYKIRIIPRSVEFL